MHVLVGKGEGSEGQRAYALRVDVAGVPIAPKPPPACRCEGGPRFARQADGLGVRCLSCGKRPVATAALTVARFRSA